MSKYMLFMQRFARSYTFHHKSTGAQSHIPRKHHPSMPFSTFILHLFTGSRNNSTVWRPKLQFKDHWCLGIRKELCKTSEQPHRQTEIASELVIEKYLYCTLFDTEAIPFAMHLAQQFLNIFNK